MRKSSPQQSYAAPPALSRHILMLWIAVAITFFGLTLFFGTLELTVLITVIIAIPVHIYYIFPNTQSIFQHMLNQKHLLLFLLVLPCFIWTGLQNNQWLMLIVLIFTLVSLWCLAWFSMHRQSFSSLTSSQMLQEEFAKMELTSQTTKPQQQAQNTVSTTSPLITSAHSKQLDSEPQQSSHIWKSKSKDRRKLAALEHTLKQTSRKK